MLHSFNFMGIVYIICTVHKDVGAVLLCLPHWLAGLITLLSQLFFSYGYQWPLSTYQAS
jgi:hypothetical protein